jgi:chromosome transmission fidelity protein 1
VTPWDGNAIVRLLLMYSCVVMVGLPYPNPNDPVLKEKIDYINKLQTKPGNTQATTSGSEYYDNLCIKAVNQSIGRSIRHKNDYATIVLLDKRYQTPRISKKFPKWIGDSVKKPNSFGEGFGSISRYSTTFQL